MEHLAEDRSASAAFRRARERLHETFGSPPPPQYEKEESGQAIVDLDKARAQLEHFEGVWREKLTAGTPMDVDNIERCLRNLDGLIEQGDQDHPVIQHAQRLADELRKYLQRGNDAEPHLPLAPVVVTRTEKPSRRHRCSKCKKMYDGPRGYCRPCHAAYNREHRKKQRAELVRLRGSGWRRSNAVAQKRA
jgi:hypothetical protein